MSGFLDQNTLNSISARTVLPQALLRSLQCTPRSLTVFEEVTSERRKGDGRKGIGKKREKKGKRKKENET